MKTTLRTLLSNVTVSALRRTLLNMVVFLRILRRILNMIFTFRTLLNVATAPTPEESTLRWRRGPWASYISLPNCGKNDNGFGLGGASPTTPPPPPPPCPMKPPPMPKILCMSLRVQKKIPEASQSAPLDFSKRSFTFPPLSTPGHP